MKERFIKEAMRLKAMPYWVRGAVVVLLILVLYQLFLELSYYFDLTALGSCPDCAR